MGGQGQEQSVMVRECIRTQKTGQLLAVLGVVGGPGKTWGLSRGFPSQCAQWEGSQDNAEPRADWVKKYRQA